MRFAVIGLSHRTASIDLRERFAQHTSDPASILAQVRGLELIEEACVISTCNRVEFYVAGSSDPLALARSLRGHLHGFSGLALEDLEPHLYQHEGDEGLRHLFRVASSLDSMVLGEPQILGQVKQAFRIASELGACGPTLTRAFQRAFTVAKRVRSETGISENAVSISFAAVELGREIFDSLAGKEVLLIGAGKMGTLAAKHLRASGVGQVRVASRSIQTAERLAKEISGLPSSLDDLPMLLREADIVISSTAAPGYIVDKKMMQRVVRERRYRPILFVDIAVPRDIDPAVADLDNVFVYDIDDLESVLVVNRGARAREAEAAERLVAVELARFVRWAKSQQVVPVIKAIRAKAGEIAEDESARTIAYAKIEDRKTTQSVRAMGQAIVNKLLHPVLTRLKEEGAEGDPQPLIDALVALFEIAPGDLLPAEQADDPAAEADNVVPFPHKDAAGGEQGS